MLDFSTTRGWLLGAALAGTVAAVSWVGGHDEEAKKPSRAGASAQSAARREAPAMAPAAEAAGEQAAAPADIDLAKLERRAQNQEFGEMFPSRSWQPPPPPPPPVRKPEPPRAPPLPFAFYGRQAGENETWVFLTRRDDTFAVKVGDTIDGAYRVDEINAATVVLTYLPLNQKQTLQIGAIN